MLPHRAYLDSSRFLPSPAGRMLKKFVRQARSECRAEEVQTALRVGRSPFEWILANGKAPTVLPTSEKPLLNVEGLNDARTLLADCFSILLGGLLWFVEHKVHDDNHG